MWQTKIIMHAILYLEHMHAGPQTVLSGRVGHIPIKCLPYSFEMEPRGRFQCNRVPPTFPAKMCVGELSSSSRSWQFPMGHHHITETSLLAESGSFQTWVPVPVHKRFANVCNSFRRYAHTHDVTKDISGLSSRSLRAAYCIDLEISLRWVLIILIRAKGSYFQMSRPNVL